MKFTRVTVLALFLLVPQMAAAQNTVVSGWLDVTDFGAIPDDGIDDTAAIQAAADRMNPGASQPPRPGAVLYFPPGMFQVSGTITIKGNGIVTGAGMHRTIIRSTNPTYAVFTTENGNTNGDISFRDFKIDVPDNVTASNGAGIQLSTPIATPPATQQGLQQHGRVENVWIDRLYRGVMVTNAAYWIIRDSVITATVADGIVINVAAPFNSDAGDNLVTGCIISGIANGVAVGTNGIYIQSSGGERIIGNKINGYNIGVYAAPSSTDHALVDLTIANNSIENQNSVGVLWQTPVAGSSIANGHIVGNQFGLQHGAAITLAGAIGGVVINDNQISIAYANALGIGTYGAANGAPTRLTIVGNNITGDADGAVGIHAGAVVMSDIHGNHIPDVSLPNRYIYVFGRISDADFTAAKLLATDGAGQAANGSVVYCTDCVVAASCAGSGSGALAKRINNAWVCN